MQIERHSWSQVRKTITQYEPTLSKIIDSLSPDGSYCFYKVRYPYGASILDKGTFQVINDKKKLVPLEHNSVSKKIQSDLNYTGTMPVGFVTNNSVETFFTGEGRIVPASLYGPGSMFSLWRIFDGASSYQDCGLWNVSSGARTICMLPKIADKNGYRNLKSKFSLNLQTTPTLVDQWDIFKTLANHNLFSENWYSEIICFSKKWFSHKSDPSWAPFYYYLLNNVWSSSPFHRNQYVLDFLFSVAQEKNRLKPNPYLADTVKHLIGIGTGEVPGFIAAKDSSAAPVRGLQEVFLNDYLLKRYAPVIMHLGHLEGSANLPILYSLQLPTTTVFSPRSSRIYSKIADMREIKFILELFFSEISNNGMTLKDMPLSLLERDYQYGFFHSDKDSHGEIKQISELMSMEPMFTRALTDSTTYEFPEFSPFFKGCIVLQQK